MNGATLDFNAVKGFDIPADVATATANQVPAAGSAVAVLRVGSATAVYTISLQDGTAINFGTVGNGATTLRGLALANNTAGKPAALSTHPLGSRGGALRRSPFVLVSEADLDT